ncbi:MAG: EamA family transporter [Bacillota bacterium]
MYALAAAALWAGCGTLAKYLFNQGLQPADLVALRLWISSGVLVLALACTNRRQLILDRSSLGALLVLGFANTGMQFSYFTAISHTNVATAVFLQYLAPVLVAVWGSLTREETFTRRTAVALALTTAGIFLLATGGSYRQLAISPAGLCSGLVAAGFFAAYTVFSRRRLSSSHPVTVLTYVLLVSALLWSLYRPPWRLDPAWAATTPALAVGSIGVLGTVLPFWFYLRSLGLLPATHTITTSTTEPLLGLVLAYALLGETMLLGQLSGGLLILGAIGILAGGRHLQPGRLAVGFHRRTGA